MPYTDVIHTKQHILRDTTCDDLMRVVSTCCILNLKYSVPHTTPAPFAGPWYCLSIRVSRACSHSCCCCRCSLLLAAPVCCCCICFRPTCRRLLRFVAVAACAAVFPPPAAAAFAAAAPVAVVVARAAINCCCCCCCFRPYSLTDHCPKCLLPCNGSDTTCYTNLHHQRILLYYRIHFHTTFV